VTARSRQRDPLRALARGERPSVPAGAGEPPGIPLAWMLAIVALAAILRFVRLGHSPPGLNQDEAIDAWNAWCLLKTGHDMTGAAWPVFYSHTVGDNRTTLLYYLLIPFQALFGLSVLSTRLPAAFFGTLAVPLLGFTAARWWGRRAGVIAALLLAVDPWPLFLSRWSVEGCVTPFFAILPVALLTAAGLLPRVDRPRAGRALLAGLAAGLATYGYWSMRLWVPAWLIATFALAGPTVWREWAERRARGAWLAFCAGLAVTFGPLMVRHVVDPAIAQRAVMTRLWEPGTPPATILGLVAQRYVIHFGWKFLFGSGDTYELLQPAVDGAMHRFLLPLFLAGLVAAIARFRRDPAARALLALVLVYPAGDLVARYDGVHELRSAAGIGGLVMLAAFGAISAWNALWFRSRALARGVGLAFAAIALGFVVRALVVFYGEYDRRPIVWHAFQSDFGDAMGWLRPRFARADAVFSTRLFLNEPWSIAMVRLGYDPLRWFAEPREQVVHDGWEDYRRVGKLRFIFDDAAKRDADSLQADHRADRVFFIVRPRQLGLRNPVHVVKEAAGGGLGEVMWVCEDTL